MAGETMATSEMLVQIDAAIGAIVSGAQEYKIGTRYIKKADLETLLKYRDKLKLDCGGDGQSPELLVNTFAAVFDRR